MDAGEDDPSASRFSFHDRGRAVRIFPDDSTPTSELRTVLPVLIKRSSTGIADLYRCLAGSPVVVGVKVEPDTRSEIQPVVHRIAAEKSACANAEVIQAALDRVADVTGSVRRQPLSDTDRVSSWN